MTTTNEDAAIAMFGRLMAAADDCDTDLVTSLLTEAQEAGIPLTLEDNPDEASWDEGYPLVEVDYELKLGSVVVARWQASYSGQYGCGGTGWWVGVLNSDQPAEVELILECADICIDMPDVPSEEDEESQ